MVYNDTLISRCISLEKWWNSVPHNGGFLKTTFYNQLLTPCSRNKYDLFSKRNWNEIMYLTIWVIFLQPLSIKWNLSWRIQPISKCATTNSPLIKYPQIFIIKLHLLCVLMVLFWFQFTVSPTKSFKIISLTIWNLWCNDRTSV